MDKKNHLFLVILFLALGLNCIFCARGFAEEVDGNGVTPEFNFNSQFLKNFYVSPREEFITPEQLEKKNALFVSEALSQITSIQTIGHPLGGITPSLFLRGANSEFTQVMWNGLTLNDSTSVSGGADYLSVNREFSSQVRILRGPETLFYGPESLSGLILLERGEFRDQKLKVSLSEFATVDLEYEKRKDFANSRVLFGGSLFSTDGISNVHDNSSVFERDRKVQNSLTAIYETETQQRQMQMLVNYFTQRTEDDLFAQEDLNAFSKTKNLQGFFQLKSPLRLLDMNFKQQFEATATQSDRTNSNPPDDNNPSSYESNYGGQRIKLKEALLLESSSTKSWFGLEYSKESMQATEYYNQIETDRFNELQQNVSAFAITSRPSLWNTRLELGVRVDQSLTKAMQLQWQKDGVYGLIASGYKTPSLYQRFSSYGNPDLKTQKSILYELGGAWGLPGGFSSRSALYRNDYEELIVYSINRFENFSRVKAQGAEAELTWQGPSSELKFSIQYNEIFQLDPIKTLARRPHWIARSDIEKYIGNSAQVGLESEWQASRQDFDPLGSELTLPSYSLFHAKVSYQIRRASDLKSTPAESSPLTESRPQSDEKLVLRINNLLDAAYQQAYGYSSPSRFVSFSYQLNN